MSMDTGEVLAIPPTPERFEITTLYVKDEKDPQALVWEWGTLIANFMSLALADEYVRMRKAKGIALDLMAKMDWL